MFASYSTEAGLKEQLRRILTDLIFKYSKHDKDKRNNENMISDGSTEYSLAEYFELGWFLSRLCIEVPVDADSSIQQKNVFKNTMSVLLALVNHYKLLNDESILKLVTYEKIIQMIGLKGYIKECGKEEFENVQQILAMCRLSLIKKLVKKKSAAFQMG